MSKQRKRERPRAVRREQARQQQHQRPRPAKAGQRPWLLPVGATVGVLAVAVVLILLNRPHPSPPNPAPSTQTSLITQLGSVPKANLDRVGIGSANKSHFGPVSESPLTSDGKPEVLYMGAEYCPFCAAERWPLIVALSRFGTFSGVQTLTSGERDVPTFTFKHASYTSQYISLVTVEQADNSGNRLQTPTAEEVSLINKYSQPAGSIPFVDFGNRLFVNGATFDYSVLTGMSWGDIADALNTTSSDQAQGILGSANLITASICKLTSDQPADVCSDPVLQGLEHQLPG